jgi:predicted molibdopterin-dependent oxidoreductase YjgC
VGTAGDRGAPVAFTFDGRAVTGRAGQSVAIALWDAGIRTLRRSPRDGAPRGMFCAIGICQECVVMIDGVRRPGCTTLVQPGLRVLPVPDPSTGPGH